VKLKSEILDLSEVIHLFRLYKKALKPEKREIKYVRMTKGRRGRVPRPTGGRYKVVDARMKKVIKLYYLSHILIQILGSSKHESQERQEIEG
jgi:hypothetical protein